MDLITHSDVQTYVAASCTTGHRLAPTYTYVMSPTVATIFLFPLKSLLHKRQKKKEDFHLYTEAIDFIVTAV